MAKLHDPQVQAEGDQDHAVPHQDAADEAQATVRIASPSLPSLSLPFPPSPPTAPLKHTNQILLPDLNLSASRRSSTAEKPSASARPSPPRTSRSRSRRSCSTASRAKPTATRRSTSTRPSGRPCSTARSARRRATRTSSSCWTRRARRSWRMRRSSRMMRGGAIGSS